ncbi:hypothetical protein Trydic_g10452 [Trypoxylus dichotomus]
MRYKDRWASEPTSVRSPQFLPFLVAPSEETNYIRKVIVTVLITIRKCHVNYGVHAKLYNDQAKEEIWLWLFTAKQSAVAPTQVPALDMIPAVRIAIEKAKPKEIRQNISKAQQRILQELMSDRNIKTLPEDKGNATVTMDVGTYNIKVQEIINAGKYRVGGIQNTTSSEQIQIGSTQPTQLYEAAPY